MLARKGLLGGIIASSSDGRFCLWKALRGHGLAWRRSDFLMSMLLACKIVVSLYLLLGGFGLFGQNGDWSAVRFDRDLSESQY